MKTQWITRRTIAALTAVTMTLVAFSPGGSRLIAGLFRQERCELPRRMPCNDCSFGFNRTIWRPWGVCCESSPGYWSADPVYELSPAHQPAPRHSLESDSAVPADSPATGQPLQRQPRDLSDTPAIPMIEDDEPSPAPQPGGSDDLPPILSGPSPGYSVPDQSTFIPEQSPVTDGAVSGDGRSRPSSSRPSRPARQAPVSPEVRSIAPQVMPPTPNDTSPVNARPFSGPDHSASGAAGAARGPFSPHSPIRSAPAGPVFAPGSNRPLPPAGIGAEQPPGDYSEYIPLPDADSIPKTLPLPNPADRTRRPLHRTPPREASPPAGDSFDPNRIPLPQPETRPVVSPPDAPGVTQTGNPFFDHRYSGFRTLPTAPSDDAPLLWSESSSDRLAAARLSARHRTSSRHRELTGSGAVTPISGQSRVSSDSQWRPMSTVAIPTATDSSHRIWRRGTDDAAERPPRKAAAGRGLYVNSFHHDSEQPARRDGLGRSPGPEPFSQWQPVRTVAGRAQATAHSSRLTRR